MEQNKQSEITVGWDQFTEKDKMTVVECYRQHLKLPKSKLITLKRVLELAKPDMILGKNETGSYARISESSLDVVGILLKNYI